mgnify:CR=1 FL=1
MILTDEEIKNVLGEEAEDFISVLNTVNDMIENPGKYTQQRAVLEAIRLSAYRTKIGAKANWLKSQDKNILVRRQKDILISMENNLVENINCLKLAARIDAKAAGLL